MKTASIARIKQELNNLSQKQLIDLCIRLIKYKKENKELTGYLLFDAVDEDEFIEGVKAEIEIQFAEINQNKMYFTRKSLRKILRITNKYIKYSGRKTTEIELLLFFCRKLKNSGIAYKSVDSLNNLYLNQLKKIKKTISLLHEDLQYDYQLEIDKLKV
jgi:hypothetical protein